MTFILNSPDEVVEPGTKFCVVINTMVEKAIGWAVFFALEALMYFVLFLMALFARTLKLVSLIS